MRHSADRQRRRLALRLRARYRPGRVGEAQISTVSPRLKRSVALRWPSARYLAGVVLLGLVYFGAAKLGQTLRYTASVSAIWPPAGLGIAALYLWGLRWWPGIFLGELLVNGQLLVDHTSLPLGSLVGQQAGNMAEIIIGAWLLRRLIGPRAMLDRVEQVGGMMFAAGMATAISATVGSISMLAGGVIDLSELPTFWRTWFLGDTSGALVVIPLILTWRDPRGAWLRMRNAEGLLLIGLVVSLAAIALTSNSPVLYLIFPAVIWAAFRFGPPGVALAVAITAGLTIGITAHRAGVFFSQPIDERTVSTQLYILVVALTGLFLSAAVCERERSAADAAEAKRREAERALEERRRIARDLHDSVAQALFSSVLHTRAAQKSVLDEGGSLSEGLGEKLSTINELTKRAQLEMRRFIFEWGPESGDGLVAACERYASSLADDHGLDVEVEGPESSLPLSRSSQIQLYGIAREALTNVVKHAEVSTASLRLTVGEDHVALEIEDRGRGFDLGESHDGHYGLASMRSRAEEIDGVLEIETAHGRGSIVRVEVPIGAGGSSRAG
jgi:signal transduction histidine kinase